MFKHTLPSVVFRLLLHEQGRQPCTSSYCPNHPQPLWYVSLERELCADEVAERIVIVMAAGGLLVGHCSCSVWDSILVRRWRVICVAACWHVTVSTVSIPAEHDACFEFAWWVHLLFLRGLFRYVRYHRHATYTTQISSPRRPWSMLSGFQTD